MAVREATPGAASVTELFSQAMAGGDESAGPVAPPELDRDAPHGRDGDGNPLAPYGWTKPQRKGDPPRPKLTAGGRPGKDDGARITEAIPAAPGPAGSSKAKAGKRKTPPRIPEQDADYGQALGELGDAIWLGLSGLAMIGDKLPVIGHRLPAKKLAAEAAIFRMHQPRLCATVQLAAQHNASAARFCAKLDGGGPTWVLTAGSMLLPFFAHSRAVLSGDKALADLGTSLDSLAEQNEAAVQTYFGEVASAVQAAADELEQQQEAAA